MNDIKILFNLLKMMEYNKIVLRIKYNALELVHQSSKPASQETRKLK